MCNGGREFKAVDDSVKGYLGLSRKDNGSSILLIVIILDLILFPSPSIGYVPWSTFI